VAADCPFKASPARLDQRAVADRRTSRAPLPAAISVSGGIGDVDLYLMVRAEIRDGRSPARERELRTLVGIRKSSRWTSVLRPAAPSASDEAATFFGNQITANICDAYSLDDGGEWMVVTPEGFI